MQEQQMYLEQPNKNKYGIFLRDLPKTMKKSEVKNFLISQKVDSSKIISIHIDADQNGYCNGNGSCLFTSFVEAKAAMNLLCGVVVNDSKVNASILMDKEVLKYLNKSDQAILISQLNPGVDEQMIIKVIEKQYIITVMSVIINFNPYYKTNEASIILESSSEAKELIDLKFIKSLSKRQINYQNREKVEKKQNIQNQNMVIVEFENPLNELEPQKYKDIIEYFLIFALHLEVASVVLWGKNGRHQIKEDKYHEKTKNQQKHCQGRNNIDKFRVPVGIKLEPEVYDCYLNPTSTCDKLSYSRRKVLIDFKYGKYCEAFFKRLQNQKGMKIPIKETNNFIRVVKITLYCDKQKTMSFKPKEEGSSNQVQQNEIQKYRNESNYYD